MVPKGTMRRDHPKEQAVPWMTQKETQIAYSSSLLSFAIPSAALPSEVTQNSTVTEVIT